MDTRTTRELLAEGHSSEYLRRAVEQGNLVRVRRGAYAASASPDARQRHRQLIDATLPGLRDAVLSHHSAAVVHGIELPHAVPSRVQVIRTRSSKGGGQRNGVVHTRMVRLPPEDIECVDGLVVTSRARTVVDLARGMGFDAAVILLDAALRDPAGQGKESTEYRAAIEAVIRRCGRVPGIKMARDALAFADGRAESPLESRSRLMMWRHHLPMPVLQREVLDRNGHLLARLDFAWEEEMLYGECDGQVKYGVLLAEGQTPSGAVMQEKRRANDLAALGWREIRWDDHDVRYPTVLCRRIEDALRRGIPGAA